VGVPAGLGIREEHRASWLALMADAIDETLPGRDDLRTTLMAYFGWGTAIAQEVSQDPPGTDLGDPGPTPRSGREGLL
jgi:hemoglobin